MRPRGFVYVNMISRLSKAIVFHDAVCRISFFRRSRSPRVDIWWIEIQEPSLRRTATNFEEHSYIPIGERTRIAPDLITCLHSPPPFSKEERRAGEGRERGPRRFP
jgi:hypothetical protein